MHTYIHHVMYPRCFPEKEHQLTESSNVPKLSCSCIVTLILLIQNPYFTFIYTLYFSIVIDEPLVSSENPQPFTGRKGRSMPQFNSVAQSYLTLCDPMDCSTPGFPVHHQLPELAQTHVHWVVNAIQPSDPLSSFSSCLQSFPASGSFPMKREYG